LVIILIPLITHQSGKAYGLLPWELSIGYWKQPRNGQFSNIECKKGRLFEEIDLYLDEQADFMMLIYLMDLG